MLKIEKEYENKYGNIPYDLSGRIDILCKALKKKRKKYKKDIFAEIANIRDIKWNEISYVIYLLPKATPRPRLNRNKNLFYVKGSDVNRKLFYKFMEKNPHDLITTPMKMTIDVYLPTPVSLSPEDRIPATGTDGQQRQTAQDTLAIALHTSATVSMDERGDTALQRPRQPKLVVAHLRQRLPRGDARERPYAEEQHRR